MQENKQLSITEKLNEITHVEKHGKIFLKREDEFKLIDSCGGKVRTCIALSVFADRGLVTAGSRSSPQVNIVAEVGKVLGLPVIAFTPQGELLPEVKLAAINGAIIKQVQAGYNNVIIKRARDAAKDLGYTEIPFGMDCFEAINQTRRQLVNAPFKDIKRIILPIGSGMTACGILHGLKDMGVSIPVVGVKVGADPMKRIEMYAPRDWAKNLQIIESPYNYHNEYNGKRGLLSASIDVDPIYEAKCLPYLQAGDLFWLIGKRASMTFDRDYLEMEFLKVPSKNIIQVKSNNKATFRSLV